jgi:hypothetical protein
MPVSCTSLETFTHRRHNMLVMFDIGFFNCNAGTDVWDSAYEVALCHDDAFRPRS